MFDEGISTFCIFAIIPFLILVSISAMGSVIDIDCTPLYFYTVLLWLPAGFNYAGNLTVGSQLSQANSAHVKFSVISPRSAAQRTAVIFTDLELAPSLGLDVHRFFCH